MCGADLVNDVEITVTVLSHLVPNINVMGIYRSKLLEFHNLIGSSSYSSPLTEQLIKPTVPTVLLGNLNINLM